MTYEGWANYHTWNVALWISNEESIYSGARTYAKDNPEGTYDYFITFRLHPMWGDITPDGVSWTDPTLDHDALNQFIRELGE